MLESNYGLNAISRLQHGGLGAQKGGLLASFEGHPHEKDSEPLHACEKKASGDKIPSHISGSELPGQ